MSWHAHAYLDTNVNTLQVCSGHPVQQAVLMIFFVLSPEDKMGN